MSSHSKGIHLTIRALDVHFLLRASRPPIAMSSLADATARALLYLLLPTELTYFSLYFHLHHRPRLSTSLLALALPLFLFAPALTPIPSAPLTVLQYYIGASPLPPRCAGKKTELRERSRNRGLEFPRPHKTKQRG